MIRLEHVTYTYPGGAAPALRDVSLEVPAGQVCAVIGANGAGKSTLAYALTGFVPHFYRGSLSGTLSVAGQLTRTTPLSELTAVAGLVLQNPFNQMSGTKYTVREEVAFGLENLGVPRAEMAERVQAMLALVGIEPLADRFPLSLSGGQMQRVAIASVLVMRPRVLVLDEPTSQLDPVGSREVFATIQALAADHRMTVIIMEHKLEWIGRYTERVVALADGVVVADGPPDEVLADERLAALGIGHTRYTLAAQRARAAGLWPAARPLPVTLDAAVAGFSASSQP